MTDDAIRDARTEHARVVSARVRLEAAIHLVAAASAEVAVTVGSQHDAARSVAAALQQGRVALAKLDLVIRRMP